MSRVWVTLLVMSFLNLTGIDASGCSPLWETGKSYKPGDLASYHGKNYKCLTAHAAITTWNPLDAFSLWQDMGQCTEPDSENQCCPCSGPVPTSSTTTTTRPTTTTTTTTTRPTTTTTTGPTTTTTTSNPLDPNLPMCAKSFIVGTVIDVGMYEHGGRNYNHTYKQTPSPSGVAWGPLQDPIYWKDMGPCRLDPSYVMMKCWGQEFKQSQGYGMADKFHYQGRNYIGTRARFGIPGVNHLDFFDYGPCTHSPKALPACYPPLGANHIMFGVMYEFNGHHYIAHNREGTIPISHSMPKTATPISHPRNFDEVGACDVHSRIFKGMLIQLRKRGGVLQM